ncbi:RHS repeat-associated core domain-containing protein [Humisphaera borealis]|uniref:RHS repeat-associated core domain-containing protein n=1 Tax=Humisphaera borealis TaxID=2807512 RepID=A0A7M2WQ27_9BACT|nr:RHS repeat-associated core domain-containing protein [Humisphaera borealis]QOV87556.1 RHS repeat-associated core domain-containing protein [Humisphaera borealis]
MIIRIDYPQPDARLDLWGGVSGTFAGLDRFNRIIDQRWQNAVGTTPADIDRYKYGYDRDSNRTWKQNTVGSTLDEYYTYDQLNRLATMDRGTLTGSPPSGITGTPVKEQDWTLDPTGNWRGYVTKASGTTDLNQARASNTVNQITGITETTGPSWIDPAYDAAGNTTTFPQPTPTSSFTATYDAWNRLKDVNDGANAVAKYDYEARNRRIVNKSYTGGTLTETRHAYYTTNWQNIEERVGSNTTADTQHVWGIRYIDELVCRDDATPARIYACQDANFNLTALISTAGSVLQRFVYEPYGIDSVRAANWSTTTDAYNWTVRFQSGRVDNGTGLYYFRNRDYVSTLGRWGQRDSGEYIDGCNLFAFVESNPVNMTDPEGLQTTAKNAETANDAKPATRPTTSPATSPATRPSTKPSTKPVTDPHKIAPRPRFIRKLKFEGGKIRGHHSFSFLSAHCPCPAVPRVTPSQISRSPSS